MTIPRPAHVPVQFIRDDAPAPAAELHPRGRTALAATALGLLVCIVLAPFVRGQFVLSDHVEIASNSALKSWGEGLRTIWLTPGSLPHASPLAYTVLLVESRVFQSRPAGFRATSILLHALVAVMLWMLLRELALPDAWAAAALFALHPIHAETVASAAQQRVLLAGVFYFTGLILWVRGNEHPRRGYLALVFMIASALCHPIGLTFPLAAAALDARRGGRAAPGPLVAMLLVSLAMLALLLVIDAPGSPAAARVVQSIPPSLARLVWTAGPAIGLQASMFSIVSGWMLLIALIVACMLWRRRLPRGAGVVLLLFGTAILPALVSPMDSRASLVADHRLYFACAVAVVAAVTGFASRLAQVRPIAIIATVAAIALISVPTMLRSATFRSDESIWRAVLRTNPDSPDARVAMARLELRQRSSPRGAIADLQRALRVDPEHRDALLELAAAHAVLQQWDVAVQRYRQVLSRDAHDIDALLGLAAAYAHQDRTLEAIETLERVVQIDPNDSRPHLELCALYRQRGEPQRALEHGERALRLDPRNPDVHVELAGLMFNHFSDPARAQALLVRARRLDPAKLETILLAGAIQFELAKAQPDPALRRDALADAVWFFVEAVRLAPHSALAHKNLGIALAAASMHMPDEMARANALGEAIFHFERSAALEPDQADIRALLRAAQRDREALLPPSPPEERR